MRNTGKEFKAYAGMILYTFIIGFSFIFVKIALRSAGTTDVLAHRFTAATLGLLVVYASGKVKRPRFTFRQMLPLLGLSFPYPLLFFALQTEGLKFTTASEAGILSAMMPVLTVVVASLFLKERSNFLQILSILLSVAGIVYILLKSGLHVESANVKGNLLILLSVLSIVAYYVFARKVNRNYPSLDITFFMTIIACVAFNAVALFSHVKSGTLNLFFEPLRETGFLGSFIYLGVLSSFVTSFLSNFALSAIPASQVAIFNNLSPIIAILGGVLLLGEKLCSFHIVGGLLVLVGVAGTLFFRSHQDMN